MKVRREVSGNNCFAVSNVFVDEFLEKLSGNAVKLYLYILSRLENEGIMYDPVAREKLRFSEADYDAAMLELNDYGVISYEKGQYVRVTASEKLSEARKKFSGKKFESKTEDAVFSEELKTVLATINGEFFGGKMSISWYNLIEKFAKEYEFLPETIYLVFSETEKFRDRSSSGYKPYIEKVALSWYQNNVKTPEDAAALIDERKRKTDYVVFVKKKLNFSRNFTEAEVNTILSWKEAGIDEEMLSVVLNDTGRVGALTIEKINNRVTEWKNAGLKNAEEVKSFAEDKKKTKTNSPKKDNTQTHFENERKYTDDYLNELLMRDQNGGKK